MIRSMCRVTVCSDMYFRSSHSFVSDPIATKSGDNADNGSLQSQSVYENDLHSFDAACSSAHSTDLHEFNKSLMDPVPSVKSRGKYRENLTRIYALVKHATSNPTCGSVPAGAMVELLQAEKEGWACGPHSDFLLEQNITAGDRASVVDSMTRVATQLQLPSDVLFLGVTCLDRFLAANSLQPSLLDAAALACLWVAVKFEHRLVPSAVQFLAAAQHDAASTANKGLLVDMEAQVLKALEYRVQPYPTTKTFLRTIFKSYMNKLQDDEQDLQLDVDSTALSKYSGGSTSQQIDPRLYYTASYLAEASLLEYKLVPCAASQVAAAVFASANLLVGCPLHDAQLLELTGYSLVSIKPAMQWLLAVHHVLYKGRTLPADSMYETARKHMHTNVWSVALLPSICSVLDPRLRIAAC